MGPNQGLGFGASGIWRALGVPGVHIGALGRGSGTYMKVVSSRCLGLADIGCFELFERFRVWVQGCFLVWGLGLRV